MSPGEIAADLRRFGAEAKAKHPKAQKKAKGLWARLSRELRDEERVQLAVAWDRMKLNGPCELDDVVKGLASRYARRA